MYRYVAISLFLVVQYSCITSIPSPLRVTIDCSDEKSSSRTWVSRSRLPEQIRHDDRFDVNSFCNLIHSALPKDVKNGRFILIEPDLDQTGSGDTISPISIAPPKDFLSQIGIPRFKPPKLKIPKIAVPTLHSRDMSFSPPRVAAPVYKPTPRYPDEEESSAEKLELFKKGIQKMLQFVKILGKIDQYLSERTRIIVDKLSKTFTD